MHSAPKYTLIGSGIILVIATILTISGFADVMDIDVEEEAIFQGTSGTVEVQEYGTYTVYVNDQYTCAETEISITDSEFEYFYRDCDSALNEDGWRVVGVFSSEIDTQYSVESNYEIVIIDDIVYGQEGGFAILGGGGACCCGIIMLVVGLIMAVTMKENLPQQVVVIPHGSQQVAYSVQPTGYTPGQPVVMNQEVSYQPPLQSDQPWQPPNSGV
tara:strand:- start:312 stop:956 length:645 start_codon:yes stop_codon:yes gene_type:complete